MTLRLARTRIRRVAALGGILGVVAGSVAVRAALAPTTHSALATSGLASAVHTPPSAAASPSAPAGTASSPARRRHRHHHAARAASPAAPTNHQVTGRAYNVGYGVVQVQVTMQGRRITDVRAVSLPQGGRSSDISSYAAPQLRSEALSRQSARIDSVSGASYTSAGYARSLQSALDRSGS